MIGKSQDWNKIFSKLVHNRFAEALPSPEQPSPSESINVPEPELSFDIKQVKQYPEEVRDQMIAKRLLQYNVILEALLNNKKVGKSELNQVKKELTELLSQAMEANKLKRKALGDKKPGRKEFIEKTDEEQLTPKKVEEKLSKEDKGKEVILKEHNVEKLDPNFPEAIGQTKPEPEPIETKVSEPELSGLEKELKEDLYITPPTKEEAEAAIEEAAEGVEDVSIKTPEQVMEEESKVKKQMALQEDAKKALREWRKLTDEKADPKLINDARQKMYDSHIKMLLNEGDLGKELTDKLRKEKEEKQMLEYWGPRSPGQGGGKQTPRAKTSLKDLVLNFTRMAAEPIFMGNLSPDVQKSMVEEEAIKRDIKRKEFPEAEPTTREYKKPETAPYKHALRVLTRDIGHVMEQWISNNKGLIARFIDTALFSMKDPDFSDLVLAIVEKTTEPHPDDKIIQDIVKKILSQNTELRTGVDGSIEDLIDFIGLEKTGLDEHTHQMLKDFLINEIEATFAALWIRVYKSQEELDMPVEDERYVNPESLTPQEFQESKTKLEKEKSLDFEPEIPYAEYQKEKLEDILDGQTIKEYISSHNLGSPIRNIISPERLNAKREKRNVNIEYLTNKLAKVIADADRAMSPSDVQYLASVIAENYMEHIPSQEESTKSRVEHSENELGQDIATQYPNEEAIAQEIKKLNEKAEGYSSKREALIAERTKRHPQLGVLEEKLRSQIETYNNALRQLKNEWVSAHHDEYEKMITDYANSFAQAAEEHEGSVLAPTKSKPSLSRKDAKEYVDTQLINSIEDSPKVQAIHEKLYPVVEQLSNQINELYKDSPQTELIEQLDYLTKSLDNRITNLTILMEGGPKKSFDPEELKKGKGLPTRAKV